MSTLSEEDLDALVQANLVPRLRERASRLHEDERWRSDYTLAADEIERLRATLEALNKAIFYDPQEIERAGQFLTIIQNGLHPQFAALKQRPP